MKGIWKRVAAGLLLAAAAASCALPVSAAWQQAEGGWWYSYPDGGYPASGFAEIDGEWYLFDENGYMLTGWQQSEGVWYYLDGSGVMQTGWLRLPEGWYYLKESGAMASGWLQDGGDWYYLDGGGKMVTGWKQLGSDWYYLDGDGRMATGSRTIGGVAYTFDASGRMVSEGGVQSPDLEAVKRLLDSVPLEPQPTADPELNALVESWLAEHLTAGMSGYEKAATIYDSLLGLAYGTPEGEDLSGLSMEEMLELLFGGPEYNARLLLQGGKGTEEHFAAALAAMLRAAGFDASVTEGAVFADGGQQDGRGTSWVTVTVNGTDYYFDPCADQRAGTGRLYFCRTADELENYQPVDTFLFRAAE